MSTEPTEDKKWPVNASPVRDKARRAIGRFERAVRAHEMKGAQPPEDWEAIDDEYTRAKRDLKNYLQYIG